MRNIIKTALSLAFIAAATLLFVSCSNPTEALNKREYFSFLKNTTDQKVTITYTRFGSDKEFMVEANSTLEIPDTERWDLTNNPEDMGTVTFTFEDGTVVVHRCTLKDGSQTDHYKRYSFEPEENNIMDQNLDDTGSWEKTSAGENNKYNMTYYIK